MMGYIRDDFSQGKGWRPPDQSFSFAYVGYTALHILKAGAVSSFVGNLLDRAGGTGLLNDRLGQLFDSHLMIVADIKGVTDRGLGADNGQDASDSVVDMAETAGLGATAVDGQGLVFEGGGYEAWDDHAVVADLSGAHGVEEANDSDGEPFFLVEEDRHGFIDRLGFRVRPAALEGGTNDSV